MMEKLKVWLDAFTQMETVLQLVGVVLVALVVGWVTRRFVVGRFEAMAARTDNDVDDRLVYFFKRFYTAILWLAVLVVVLKILKVDLTPLLASAGIAGIALGFAAKDVLGNFLAGVFLLIDRPIKIGDRILIDRIGRQWGSWGDVIDVGLRTTRVKNTDGVQVIYPNARLAESIIRNFSPTDTTLRFRTRVLIDLDNDLEMALTILAEVGKGHELTLDDPQPYAILRALYDESHGHLSYGALLELRCFLDDIRDRTRVRSALLLEIHRQFRTAGIRFATLMPAQPEG